MGQNGNTKLICNSPLVSIILPCYNSENHIEECINSLINQSYKNIEIIIINDGSIDGTETKIKTFNDERIKYISQENKGACAARNSGIRAASGNYYQFFDSDDILIADKIERQIELIDGKKNVLASSRWIQFHNKIDDSPPIDFKIFNANTPKQYFFHVLCRSEYIPLQAWLIPSDIVSRAGLFNESLDINQDGEYLARLLTHTEEIRIVDGYVGFYYRCQLNTVSTWNSGKKILSLLMSLESLSSCAEKMGIDLNETKISDIYYRTMVSGYPFSKPYISTINKLISKYGGRSKNSNKIEGGILIRTIANIFGWRLARLMQIQYSVIRSYLI